MRLTDSSTGTWLTAGRRCSLQRDSTGRWNPSLLDRRFHRFCRASSFLLRKETGQRSIAEPEHQVDPAPIIEFFSLRKRKQEQIATQAAAQTLTRVTFMFLSYRMCVPPYRGEHPWEHLWEHPWEHPCHPNVFERWGRASLATITTKRDAITVGTVSSRGCSYGC